ncbi:RNA polymerase sigma factor [Adhaeribacter radiodurans]|uniref:Sigma-70 family RNA polymerase sigma factor n=1 Tax=Adhaeribacter radiodurans TaxID=2745197 RepID=A0A7L7L7U8_9BACT|nr:sigma-70 family RNA polymerase sigma factor [Adhaeribacter radiodurans]QMU28449.1 sigma-70 family RNA polymerase sigma factor [Adhaeribacter radiodurans]
MKDQSRNIIQTISAYGKGLFNFIRGRVTTKEEAEDILQDVWYQLSHVTDLDEVEQMSGWLFRVAKNKIIDRNRKKTVESLEDFTFLGEDGEYNLADILLVDETDPETEFVKEIFWQELFTALDELPEKQKQVFIWNELEDKTLQQIADMTGEKLKTIISRKGYAVQHLRKRLENLYNEFLDI